MVRDALEREGFDVATAADGREALTQLDALDHVCVVLLDLLMPGMNGWDFFQAFRNRPDAAKIPVVVTSSAPSAAPTGVTRVMQKPIKLDRLLATVREFCAAA